MDGSVNRASADAAILYISSRTEIQQYKNPSISKLGYRSSRSLNMKLSVSLHKLRAIYETIVLKDFMILCNVGYFM